MKNTASMVPGKSQLSCGFLSEVGAATMKTRHQCPGRVAHKACGPSDASSFQGPKRSGRSRQGRPFLVLYRRRNRRSPRVECEPLLYGGSTRFRRAHCLSLSAWRCTPVFHHVLLEVAKRTGHSVVWPRCRPSWGQARRAGGRACSRRDVRRRSASFASGCQPEPEEVMEARSAAVDFRSRRGRPGASPPTPSKASVVAGVVGEGRPSAAFPYCAFSMRRIGDSPCRATLLRADSRLSADRNTGGRPREALDRRRHGV